VLGRVFILIEANKDKQEQPDLWYLGYCHSIFKIVESFPKLSLPLTKYIHQKAMEAAQPAVSFVKDHPFKQFKLFSKLPPELRLALWYMALSPRVITVAEVPVHRAGEEARLKISTSARDTPLLQVNWESRQVALEALVPILSHVNMKNPNPVYFDYSKDALCIKQDIEFTDVHRATSLFESTGSQTQNEISPIQNIIIGPDCSAWWDPKSWFRLQTMSSLKRLALIKGTLPCSHLEHFDGLWKAMPQRNRDLLGPSERMAKFAGSVTLFSTEDLNDFENGLKL
jgi:hypothetical protein